MNFVFRNRVDNRAQAERIRGWVREALGVSEDVTISVMEMRCLDPDCPPHATIIAILDAPGESRRYRFGKPMAEIGREEVIRLGSLPPPPRE